MNPIQKMIDFWASVLTGSAASSTGVSVADRLLSVRQKTKPRVDPEKVQAFRAFLAAGLTANPRRSLEVDYAPLGLLHEACTAADIPTDTYLFPVKTSTWIKNDVAYLVKGYGASPVPL